MLHAVYKIHYLYQNFQNNIKSYSLYRINIASSEALVMLLLPFTTSCSNVDFNFNFKIFHKQSPGMEQYS